MKKLLTTNIGRLRVASLLDGTSFVFLLGCSVIKRTHDMHDIIRIPGMIHGGLFVLLCLALGIVLLSRKVPFLWCLITFLCAFIPIAPFFLDRKLKTFE